MKKTTTRLVWTIVAGLGLAQPGCQQPPPRVEAPPPKVTVAKVQTREMVEYDPYNGWLDAPAIVEVRARVRGHIDKVHFTDGQMVPQGHLLFELDPRPFQSEIDRAKDQLKIFEAQAVAAQKEEARLKDLVTKGGASQSQVDKAEAEAKSLLAQIEAGQQEIKRRELDLEYSRITAPIAGRTGRAMLTPGNLVNAGGSDPLLTTIVAVDPIHLYFPVDERSLQRYQKQRGAERSATVKELKIPVSFGLETDGGYPHEGVLDFADNRVDAMTGTILVRGSAPNPQGRFVPGSRVRVRISMSASQTVSLVPDTAVLSDQDKKYLLVIDDKNVVQRRDVQLGRLLEDGMRVIIPAAGAVSALGPDEWLIVQGLQMARVNYPVEPVRPTTQPAKVAAVSAAH